MLSLICGILCRIQGFLSFYCQKKENRLPIAHTTMSRTFSMAGANKGPCPSGFNFIIIHSHFTVLRAQCLTHLCTFACVVPSLPSLLGSILRISGKAPFS